MKTLILISVALLGVGALVRPVEATHPCPQFSVVSPVIPVSPNGSLPYIVGPIYVDGPIPPGDHCPSQILGVGATIVVRFHPVADAAVCWCHPDPGPNPHEFQATTDSQGKAFFNFAGGGCVERGDSRLVPGGYAAEVFANGVKMQECGIVSPDAVDSAGRLPLASWDPAGSCATGLSDAVKHTTPLATGTYAWCSDMNGDHAVGLSDGVVLTPFLAGATSCGTGP